MFQHRYLADVSAITTRRDCLIDVSMPVPCGRLPFLVSASIRWQYYMLHFSADVLLPESTTTHLESHHLNKTPRAGDRHYDLVRVFDG